MIILRSAIYNKFDCYKLLEALSTNRIWELAINSSIHDYPKISYLKYCDCYKLLEALSTNRSTSSSTVDHPSPQSSRCITINLQWHHQDWLQLSGWTTLVNNELWLVATVKVILHSKSCHAQVCSRWVNWSVNLIHGHVLKTNTQSTHTHSYCPSLDFFTQISKKTSISSLFLSP